MPLALLTGDTVNNTPLQLTCVIAVISAVGLTVTTTVKLAPVHDPDNGVTVYVALCAALLELCKVPLIYVALVPVDIPSRLPVVVGVDQLYKVPAGTIP